MSKDSEIQAVKSESKGPWQFKPHREEPPKEGGTEAFMKWRDKIMADKEKKDMIWQALTTLTNGLHGR